MNHENDLIELKRAKERLRKARYRAKQSDKERDEERAKTRDRVARMRRGESEMEKTERRARNRERERERKARLTAFEREEKRARDRERKARRRRLQEWENLIDDTLSNGGACNLPPDDSYDWRLG